MNVGGWMFIILSWLSIIGLLVFCFRRVLGSEWRNNNHDEPIR